MDPLIAMLAQVGCEEVYGDEDEGYPEPDPGPAPTLTMPPVDDEDDVPF